ncbi:hypothetical protein SEUCBS139899_005243 [Sporothrix eucalyptigena]|uniref:Uncharacterized protein n=1 Tax=Sporothrix eucalyptigena TaxID=1812306 RepID=A0ABP0BIJ4_9PEZI
MLATGQKLLHRARSLRRLHNHSQCSDDESIPQMPASPTSPTAGFFSPSSSVAPVAIPMPMPPTQRPRTEYGSRTGLSSHHHHNMASSPDDEHVHYRQASTCSQASRASSSWSSNASTTSSTTSSRNAGLEWDSLRLHPVPSVPVIRASPQYYDSDRSFYYHNDDSYAVSSSSAAPHGFDFGFERSAAAAASKRAVRQTIADIRLVSSTDDDEGFEAQGLSAPPPSHHRLRAHQSEANLQQTMRDLQLLGASGILDRPVTPPMPDVDVSEPPSPVTPRMQPHAATESERYFKRGDWKRRGIVFSAFDD